MGKNYLLMYFRIQNAKCKGHIFADGTIQVFASTSGHKFTLDDAKIDGREFCSKEDKSGLQINHSHLALMFFGDYNSHAVLYFVSSRFLPLDLLYFKTVAILMHDTSNSLTPTNISNLFLPNLTFIHIIQDHIQDVITNVKHYRLDKQTKSFKIWRKNLE